MELRVSLKKDGKVIESEVVRNPHMESVEAAIKELIGEAGRKACGPIWPFEIEVR
jgi:hypothetical protein